ncbi:MAG: hypothetical protein HY430_01485 [Candidatus Levybacteria bacterium]|nr:hypothetical protein [Candidatus Levybacteria bacterium]
MNKRRKIILFCLLISSVVAVISYNFFLHKSSKTSVKGAQTSVSPTPTFTPSPTRSPTLTPTPTNKPISVRAQPTSQAKQSGGWYWRSEIGRAQRWLGTDAQGKDIWSDTGDQPRQAHYNTSPPSDSKNYDEIGGYPRDPSYYRVVLSPQSQQITPTPNSGTVSMSQSMQTK